MLHIAPSEQILMLFLPLYTYHYLQVHRTVSQSVHSRITTVEQGMSQKMESTLKSQVIATGAYVPACVQLRCAGMICITLLAEACLPRLTDSPGQIA